MTADARVGLVLLVHHRHGVPADESLDATLEVAVAGVGYFVVPGDGVEVGRRDVAGRRHAGLAGTGAQSGKNGGTLLPVLSDHLVECLDPLCDFGGHVLVYGFVNVCRHGLLGIALKSDASRILRVSAVASGGFV